MSELEELRERLAILEDRVEQQDQLIVRQALSRTAEDRGQTDMARRVAATHHLAQAIAITQPDHGDSLARIESKIDSIAVNLGIVVDALNAMIDRD